MARNGLSKARVVQAAAALIETSGVAAFSMRTLAESLNVKPASLYNHVESMESLMISVCVYALNLQKDTQMQAIAGKSGEEAVFSLANACRRFAKEHRNLYHLIMHTAAVCPDPLSEISQCMVEPFMTLLRDTPFTETEKIHFQRVLRGLIHGFISQEDAGFFSHLPAAADESFQVALRCYMDGFHQAEKRKQI